MKKHYSRILFIVFAVVLVLSCSKSDNPATDNPVGGDAFRMQMVTINLPNTTLSATEYHGSVGSTTVNLIKSDDHKLLFMMPSSVALGNQDLVINDLNNLKITYNVKDVVLPDTADATISPFQNNLATFQATTLGNTQTQNAITSYTKYMPMLLQQIKLKWRHYTMPTKLCLTILFLMILILLQVDHCRNL